MEIFCRFDFLSAILMLLKKGQAVWGDLSKDIFLGYKNQ